MNGITPTNIAIGLGAAAGIGAGIAATVHSVRTEKRAIEVADREWAATRPGRQDEVDTANDYVSDMAERFDPEARIHTTDGLRDASIYDPDHEAADYIRSHADEIPAHVDTNLDGYYSGDAYDGSYVRLRTLEPRRPQVEKTAASLGYAMLGGLGAGVIGGAIAVKAHGALGAIGAGLATAGAAATFVAFMGDQFLPETATQW